MATANQRLKNTARVPVKLGKKAEEALLGYFNRIVDSYCFQDLRDRMEQIDRAYHLESYLKDEHGQPVKKIDWEMPVIQPDVDAAHAYMLETFVADNQVFRTVAPPGKEAIGHQLQAIISDNTNFFKWERQLGLFFKDGIKYNLHALECEWKRKEVYLVENDMRANNRSDHKVTTTEYEGNRVRRIDPYNMFFDQSVDVADVSVEGQYAGYFERLSLTQLFQLIADLKLDNYSVMNEGKEMWESVPHKNLYFKPSIQEDLIAARKDTGWNSFFDDTYVSKHGGKDFSYQGFYEVTTLYARIIPSMFGMNVPAKDTIQVWKFKIVNGKFIIYAERQSNVHGLFPILLGQPNEDGLQLDSKSLAEALVPFQDIATELQQARFAALYRNINDRALYDSSRISKRDLDGKNPRAKIPVRPSLLGAKLSDAYQAIPFNDTISNQLTQEIQLNREYANDVSGINKPGRGGFQKGNKTKFEYQDVMANATAKQLAMAVMIENQVLKSLKHVVKSNILQYQPPTELLNPETREPMQITPENLRSTILEFKLADGIVPESNIIDPQVLREGFMFLAQSPQLQVKYDMGKMFATLIGMKVDISKFEYTPEEQQAMQQQQLALAGKAQPNE